MAGLSGRPISGLTLAVGLVAVVVGLVLVVLLSIPWGLAVARRLASPSGPERALPS